MWVMRGTTCFKCAASYDIRRGSQQREREKLHYVHSASLAYEDGSVFMSGPFAEWL